MIISKWPKQYWQACEIIIGKLLKELYNTEEGKKYNCGKPDFENNEYIFDAKVSCYDGSQRAIKSYKPIGKKYYAVAFNLEQGEDKLFNKNKDIILLYDDLILKLPYNRQQGYIVMKNIIRKIYHKTYIVDTIN
jgi:hypothetical protein